MKNVFMRWMKRLTKISEPYKYNLIIDTYFFICFQEISA